ncbi:MAG: MOSC domain-containing protein [Pseudomonadota bacterium]
MSKGSVEGLYRYPVKGLSGERVDALSLMAGEGVEHDRTIGFLRPHIPFDEAAPKSLQKTCFYMLARDAALAQLSTRYDPQSDALTIERNGSGEAYDLSTTKGVSGAERAIQSALSLPDEARPRLVRGGAHRFTDVSVVSETFMNAISLINLASVRDLGRRIGAQVDPLRFRGNIVFDGWPAWSELEGEGRTIAIGDVRLKVLLRTQRCAATTVNPATAQRDLFIPKHLMDEYGHADMGIYAEVLSGGTVKPGDAITLE